VSVTLTGAWRDMEVTLRYTAKAEAIPQPPGLFAAAANLLLQEGAPEPKWETRQPEDRPDVGGWPIPLPDPALPRFDTLFSPRDWQREVLPLLRALQRRGWSTAAGALPLPGSQPAATGHAECVFHLLQPEEETTGLTKLNLDTLKRRHGDAEVVLVSPREWSRADREHLHRSQTGRKPRIHLLGQRELEALLRAAPPLLAWFYPLEAAQQHPAQASAAHSRKQVRQAYLSGIGKRLPEINLVGFPRHKTQHVKHRFLPLGRIFEPPDFRPETAPLDDPTPATTLAELLTASPSCVLLGEAGAGKTTLLHYAGCVWSGAESLSGAQVAPRVPLLLPLRDFADARSKDAQADLASTLVRHAQTYAGLTASEAPDRFFLALLELGEAAVLLDGLDEAGDDAERREMARRIQDFHQQRFPDCPVWVTSRVVGYDDCRLDGSAFTHLRVEPFTPAQRDSFIRKWYALQVPEPVAGTTSAPDSLITTLNSPRTHEDVKHMAGNALLLSLMALIHYTGGELPQKRGELYEQCVRTLVDQWERVKDPERRHEVLERLKITAHRAEVYLAAVAFAAQRADDARGEADVGAQGAIPEELARACILPLRVADREDASEKTAAEEVELFLRYVRERAGLLIWRGARTYAFVHRSFQEYLAAYQQAANKDRGARRQRNFFLYLVRKPAWRETLLLFLYHLNRGTSPSSFLDELVKDALRRDLGNHPRATWQTLTLAIRDELRATPATKRQVLKQAVLGWANEATDQNEEFKALQDLVQFARDQVPHLRTALAEIWQGEVDPNLWTSERRK